MQSLIQKVEAKHRKQNVVDVRSGDTVKVHQKIVEGGKERVQIFEGLVIAVSRKDSLMSSFTVRRIASGIGVEKTYLIHSPNVVKIEVTKRSKVRRNKLNYMRALTGKRARLTGVDFDRKAVNELPADVKEEAVAEVADAPIEDVVAEAPQVDAEAPAEETTAQA